MAFVMSPPEPAQCKLALMRLGRQAKRLCELARMGDAEQMETLLDDGANPELPGFGGNTPLMVAAWNDRADCVALLLARGARVNHGDPDYGYTPLLLASQYGALAAAKQLVKAGADLTCRLTGGPDEGMTARAVALGGTSRVYADPQPGRAVRASHSRDARVGRGRIDSQHGAVAELLLQAERALAGAHQRLAFAKCFLEGQGVQGQRTFGRLPRNADGGCDLICSGERDAAPRSPEAGDGHEPEQQQQQQQQQEQQPHQPHQQQQQLADDKDVDLHAAIAASLADTAGTEPAARCAWVHLHPPGCNCTGQRGQGSSSSTAATAAAAATAPSEEMQLAARIAELEAAQQGARTGTFDFRELRRLSEEAAPLKRALIAQQESSYRKARLAEQKGLGRKEMAPNSEGEQDREGMAAGSVVEWLEALLVPQNVLAKTLDAAREG
jgi:hypothetical protein